MTIRVSDLGITRYDSQTGQNGTKVGYVSYNERMNKNPVSKVEAVSSSTSKNRSVAREAAQDFVSASTPAYTVDFSSRGLTALKGLKTLREAAKSRKEGVLGQGKESFGFRTGSRDSSVKAYSKEDRENSGKEKTRTVSNQYARAIQAYGVQMDYRVNDQRRTGSL